MSTHPFADVAPGRIVNLSRMMDRESRSATPRLSSHHPDDYSQLARIDRLLEEIDLEISEFIRSKEGREYEVVLKTKLERVTQSVKAVEQAAAPVTSDRKEEPFFAADWQQFERAWERETRSATKLTTSTSLEALVKEREQLKQDIQDLRLRDPYSLLCVRITYLMHMAKRVQFDVQKATRKLHFSPEIGCTECPEEVKLHGNLEDFPVKSILAHPHQFSDAEEEDEDDSGAENPDVVTSVSM